MWPRRCAILILAVLGAFGGACSPEAGDDGGDGGDGEGMVTFGLARASQSSGTGALLQAVSPVSSEVVWASGHEGTYVRTRDGGATWNAATVPGADSLQFRDVEAFDTLSAYLMSAGSGSLSRIYRTDDGGSSWTLQYTAEHPDAFLDCMAFWDRDRGLAYGDAVDGALFVLRTEDGGATWEPVPPAALPEAQANEGGFAASGTCVDTAPDGLAWIATGNAERARVLRTADWGETWSAVEVPVVGGSASGLTTVRFLDGRVGIALGGVIGADTLRSRNVAVSRDGGSTWSPGNSPVMTGPVYGSAWVPGMPAPSVFAVGPEGVEWSPDLGGSWRSVDTLSHWAVGFASRDAGWAVGPEGRITRFGFVAR